jgi:dipeptidyl aminopeptidase/acylaminoacyl peptidase
VNQTKSSPYGTWKSPIRSDLIVAETIGLSEARVHGDQIFWIELRPMEQGRSVIVRATADGEPEDVTPKPFSARSRVHEYGGGAYAVGGETVYFVNFADQQVYRQPIGETPEPITSGGEMRYADLVLSPDGRRLVAVREDHGAKEQEAVNSLVQINIEIEGGEEVIAEGADFVASPCFNPEGNRIAWLAGNHPAMPWDGTELWVADVGPDGHVAGGEKIAGGPTESIFQPRWSPGGLLHFVSDRSGWWNLYRWEEGRAKFLCPKQAEFGRPQWVFGMSMYGFESETSIVAVYDQAGRSHLVRLDTESGELDPIRTPHTQIQEIEVNKRSVVCVGGSPERASELVRLDSGSQVCEVLWRSSSLAIERGFLSEPEAIEFPSGEGSTAHAFFYPPRNEVFFAPDNEKPPLLVMSHGGPTSSSDTTLRLSIQFWTSRGFAVVDVNYGGSSGYGRAYRRRLEGRWGVVDVEDCVRAARHLIEAGKVDPGRVAIRGGSAGGYTTLCGLTFHDLFRAGASYYGISDLEILARDTHKFESRYLDSLIGPYPEEVDTYKARSPLNYVEQLSCPIIFFQGMDDKVVPPNQAESMFEAIRDAGIPSAYVAFEGEGHGFRRAENIKRALDAELYFYGRVFGFVPADELEPVEIENL